LSKNNLPLTIHNAFAMPRSIPTPRRGIGEFTPPQTYLDKIGVVSIIPQLSVIVLVSKAPPLIMSTTRIKKSS
jgi:hypothetical protein